MPRKKLAVPKGHFICPPILIGANPSQKRLDAAMTSARLRAGEDPDHAWPAAAALIALGPDCCKWPIGDVRAADFRFCGKKQLTEGPYCPGHHTKAHAREPLKRVRA
jgi:hypothetical protein